jgi:phospholipid/cholesterol/gamma-HCH transport system permease protein
LDELIKRPVLAVQEFYLLAGRAVRSTFGRPFYTDDLFMQMDIIGVGSLPIVVLTGFFTGAVMAMQMARALEQYGAISQTGTVVSISIVRELGPVLTAITVAGRNASGMASELGSMKVTEQIDAMRALGTDPVKKLVVPRVVATAVVLPLLTIISDFVGMFGGFIISYTVLNLPATLYWTTSWQALEYSDIFQGLLKPFVFAFAVSLVGCYFGLRTTGGTQGVGRATTQSVVVSLIVIFILTFFITRIFTSL